MTSSLATHCLDTVDPRGAVSRLAIDLGRGLQTSKDLQAQFDRVHAAVDQASINLGAIHYRPTTAVIKGFAKPLRDGACALWCTILANFDMKTVEQVEIAVADADALSKMVNVGLPELDQDFFQTLFEGGASRAISNPALAARFDEASKEIEQFALDFAAHGGLTVAVSGGQDDGYDPIYDGGSTTICASSDWWCIFFSVLVLIFIIVISVIA